MHEATLRSTARKDRVDAITPWVLLTLSAAAAAGGVLRLLAFDEPILTRLDNTTLVYFAVAGALLLLRNVKSLAFGDFKVELERVRAIAEQAQGAARVAEDAVLFGALPQAVPQPLAAARSSTIEVSRGAAEDDPWKGAFGGRAEANARRLTATVTPLPHRPEWFSVELAVASTAPRKAPLTGTVRFFLHDTFSNPQPVVPVQNGRAEISLLAWGAFTVGAVADDGSTRLELDLAELPGVPEPFRSR